MLVFAIISTFIVSLISLIGIVTIAINDEIFKRVIFILVSFSAGVLIGVAFIHLIPESFEGLNEKLSMIIVLAGFSSFFLLERILRWRHCHENECEVHPVTYLALIGDSIHNFVDGVVIVGSYMLSFDLGVMTTLAVIFHEMPQEIGDFAVLVHGGFSVRKAISFNFFTALTSVLGAIVGYFILSAHDILYQILPFAAGNFLYIASSDLIPELHKETELKRSLASFLIFIFGLLVMILL